MILNNDYYWFKSALTDDQCDEIILRGEREMSLTKERGGSLDAEAFGGTDKASMLKSGLSEDDLVSQGTKTNQSIKKEKAKGKKTFIRDTHISWLDDEEIYSWVLPYLVRANHDAGWNFEWSWSEVLQFTKYNKNQFYGWHADASPNPYLPEDGNPNYAGKIRKLSMTVNLTDPKDYKGGNLKFDFGPHAEKSRYHTCTEIRPRGSIIVFPSDRHHQVTPITSGLRYSLVMWSLGQPWK